MCRMSTALLLLLIVSSSYAATHVNISIAQQAATNPADVTYVDGRAPAELKAGPADFSYGNEERSSRLIQPEMQQQQMHQKQMHQPQPMHQQQQQQMSQQQMSMQQQHNQQSQQQKQQGHVQLQSSSGATQLGPQQMHHRNGQQRRRMHFRQGASQRAQSSQFRQKQKQDHQNQEFERYVQTYGGPTVETVFESSSPAPKHQEQASNVPSGKSQRLVVIGASRPQHTFERQVALPAAQNAASTAAAQPESKAIFEPAAAAPVVAKAAVATPAVAVSSSAPSSSVAVSSSSSSSNAPQPSDAKFNFEQSSGHNGGYDQPNFDASISYNRPSYDGNNYNYDDAQDFQDQYPPSVDADSQGYADYEDQSNYFGQPSSASNGGYLPPSRPLVTKTIQIAQPALKAKKYEVRHPAIQKEFYDIEERVIIKPAGTLVVELDHPVAKISKGETVLPLGHPHPAVASAYNGYNNNANQNQYSSNPVYNTPKEQHLQQGSQSTTIGSSVTTMPYDQTPNFVEAKLRQPYNAAGNNDASSFVSNTERSYAADDTKQPSNGLYLDMTDSKGNQLQINSKNSVPKTFARDESDFRAYAPNNLNVQNNAAPLSHNYDRSQDETANFNYNPNNNAAQFQDNYSGKNQFNEAEYFTGEYFGNNNNGNAQQDAKPARLQQAPVSSADPQIIKHEHNIRLPPSQHNIYLSRSTLVPKEQHIREEVEYPASVSEVRPYLHGHAGGTVVYAKPAVRPVVRAYKQRAEPSYVRKPVESARYRQPAVDEREGDNVEYSAPYSRMRYHSEHSARLMDQQPEKPVVVEEKQQMKPTPHTHIQIQIPHRDEPHKPIVVSSTISPPLNEPVRMVKANYREPHPDRDVEYLNEPRGDQHAYGQLNSKPDCDQVDQAHQHMQKQQHFQRLVEAAPANLSQSNANAPNLQTENVDVLPKSVAGHVSTGQRVIAATAAPTDASARSETFHKRRIVVNHPFQTVREVVEHEPITNYHQIQVNEPASPALYHQAAYYQPPVSSHGNLVYHQSSSTHGNLYALPMHHASYA